MAATRCAGGLCGGHFAVTWAVSDEDANRALLRDIQLSATTRLARTLGGQLTEPVRATAKHSSNGLARWRDELARSRAEEPIRPRPPAANGRSSSLPVGLLLARRTRPQRAEEIARWLEQGRIATCLPFLLETGYPARNARDQRQLARAGHRRLPPVDLIIAAPADIHDPGVLHYDHDYEIVSEKTDLRFDTVWLAPRRSI
ncbi:MAG: hypothetical protein ACR2NR_05995 [Solirubrobacteraceae bacterium]